MPHLTTEVLARLVDEPAASGEAAHLEGCDRCRDELDALREQSLALAGLPREWEPPARSWGRIEAELRSEGLLRSAAPPDALLRVAAAVALFALGTLAGLSLQGGNGAVGGGATVDAGGSPSFAANPTAGSAQEAARLVEQTEADYLSALSRYAELAGTGEIEADPVARLAALESIVATTRAALSAAPADPVINGYHLTALAQREAVLRQVADTGDAEWF